jgi:hypothetical protein
MVSHPCESMSSHPFPYFGNRIQYFRKVLTFFRNDSKIKIYVLEKVIFAWKLM